MEAKGRKNVSKIVVAIVAVALICACLFAFAACDKPEAEKGEKNICVTIGETTFEIESDENYLHGVLVDLLEEGKIDVYTFSESTYGPYVTACGSEKEGDGKYVMFYHDIDDIALYTPGYDREKNGVTYLSSSVGVDKIPVKDGHKYLVVAVGF